MTSSLDSDIEAFTASVLLERGESENTALAYGRDLRAFEQFLDGRRTSAAEITREDIVAFLQHAREEGLAATTRARRAIAIRMFLAYLLARHRITSNPAELLDAPKKPLPLPRILSEEEVARLIDSVSGQTPRDIRDRAILEVLYGCGLRVTELCELRREDIVAEGELVRVMGKGSKERLVPIGGAAGRALTTYDAMVRPQLVEGHPAETHLFLTRRGKPFTRQGIFKILRERAVAADIDPKRLSPHVLRHCYASHMLQHGADIRALQELLGHADIGTTQVYTHIDVARFGEIHRKYHPRA